MSLIRAMALDGKIEVADLPEAPAPPAGELVACRLNASNATLEIRMWIPEPLDILRVPIAAGGINEYRRTDLRTQDGTVIYEVRRLTVHVAHSFALTGVMTGDW